jgi:predicted transglutaminase-like cysteine proteinase
MQCRAWWAGFVIILLHSAGPLYGSEASRNIVYGSNAPIGAPAPDESTPNETSTSLNPFVSEFGPTLPPVGYVKFCATNQSECKTKGQGFSSIVMNDELRKQLNQVNRDINASIVATSDLQLYGEAERWAYPNGKGDCEDFVLAKKRKLVELGYTPAALLITVVRDEHHRGHAVLSVTTSSGDYVLDNRRDGMLLWNETHYTFLERQSQSDPMQWVALQKQGVVPEEVVYVPLTAAASGKMHY